MLEEKSFIKKLEIFDNFLQLLLIFSIVSAVYMKIFLFNSRKSSDKLDFMLVNLQQEEQFLELELNLLTNPKRLEELYSQLQNEYFADTNVLNYRQIKDLNNLYPYFYSRKETFNNGKIVAKK
jgi:hypothetical protein